MLLTNKSVHLKPRKKPEDVAVLNSMLHTVNSKMYPMKKDWSEAVLLKNRLSSDAFKHRFAIKELPDGRVDEQGHFNDADYTTAESFTGEYNVSPKYKEKRDHIVNSYTTRDAFASVKSIKSSDMISTAQFMVNSVVNNPKFKQAHASAFEDAIDKGVGFLRLRLYDYEGDSDIIELSSNKKADSFKSSPYSKGLEVEYTDVENVYIDPYVKDPKECFISTPVDGLELLSLLPQIKNKLNLGKFSQEETKSGEISPQFMGMYKLGESLVDWYHTPDKLADIYNNIENKSNLFNGLQGDYWNDIRPGWERSGFSIYMLEDHFKFFWSNLNNGYFYNNLMEASADKYRITEYYNWADPNNTRYIIYVGDYVLYDGEMFEPVKGNPLQAVYFKNPKKDSIFGQSLFQDIRQYQKQLDICDNEIKESLAINRITILEKNTSMVPDASIDAEPLTVLSVTPSDELSNMPAIRQVPIQNPSLELQFQDRQIKENELNRLYPDVFNLDAQLTKEQRDEMWYSRNIMINKILDLNSNMLSKFASKILAAKVLEFAYFRDFAVPFNIPGEQDRLLIVGANSKQVSKRQEEVRAIMEQDYVKQKQRAKMQLAQSPKFQQKVQQVVSGEMQKMMQMVQERSAKEGKPPSEDEINKMSVRYQKERLPAIRDQLLEQEASNQIPIPVDNNVYLSLEYLHSTLNISNDFVFEFDKTQEERVREIMQFMSTISQLPLSGMTINYGHFMKEIAIAYGLDPNYIAREVPSAASMQAQQSTRTNWFFDAQQYATAAGEYMEKYFGISKDKQHDPDSNTLKDLQSIKQMEAQKEIQIQTNRIKESAKGNLAKEAYKQISGNMSQQQEVDNMNALDNNPNINYNEN